MNLKAVVFDMDDTLFAEYDYVASGFRAVAQWGDDMYALDRKISFDFLLETSRSEQKGRVFNAWFDSVKTDATETEFVSAALSQYRQHLPEITPFPEITSLLTFLQDHCKVGLVSDGYLEVQKLKFQALGLAGMFQAVCFSDSLGREHWKPSAKPFEAVLQSLQVAAKDSIYIGDNPKKDFLGARNAGMHSIWLKQPTAVYSDLKPETPRHEPDLTIGSLRDLKAAIVEFKLRGETNEATI